MDFRQYPSLDNSKFCRSPAVPPDAEWIVTEKVHGTNTAVYVDAGGDVKVARRTGFAEVPKLHYRADLILDRHKAAFQAAARELIAAHGSGDALDHVVFYGELYGGVYPEVDCLPGIIPVQRGVYYSNDVHFTCFDIVVIRPSQRVAVTEGDTLLNMWREARKCLVLYEKGTPGNNPTLRINLESVEARLNAEVAKAPALALTLEFVRTVLAGGEVSVVKDMPPPPSVPVSPHESLLSQTERVSICAAFDIPGSQILFRGSREAAVAFSKQSRTAPTLMAEACGMRGPYSAREGNIVRTDVACYVGERGTLVVMKDKNPRFKEVAHSKHAAAVGDLLTEAPRFVTANRLDNVVSKVELGTDQAVLVAMLAADALADMQRRETFEKAFEEQSADGVRRLAEILEDCSRKVVAAHMAAVPGTP